MKSKSIGRELLTSFILGGVPCFIAFKHNGVTGLIDYLKAIDTSDSTVYYFLFLAFIHLLISHIGFFSPRCYGKIKVFFHSAYPVLNDVGSGLVCLYRIVTGSTLACGIVGVTYYPLIGELNSSLFLFILALPFLWMSVIISESYNYAKSKQV